MERTAEEQGAGLQYDKVIEARRLHIMKILLLTGTALSAVILYRTYAKTPTIN